MMARLLLADDDSEFLSAAKEFFQRAQMKLETVKNGLAALRQLSVVRFDLAILDVDLSGAGGLELVRTIREKGIDTSFVVLSSNASTSQIVTAMKYGADEFLDKPIDPSTLREVAVSLLAAQDGSPHYLADKVDAFLRENCPRPLHMYDVCEQFKISPSYVSKLFKNHIGTTYRRRLVFHRIQKAKNLLRSTDLLVYQIADRCGFGHCPHFNEVFKKLESISPARYRRMVWMEIGRN